MTHMLSTHKKKEERKGGRRKKEKSGEEKGKKRKRKVKSFKAKKHDLMSAPHLKGRDDVTHWNVRYFNPGSTNYFSLNFKVTVANWKLLGTDLE